MKKDIYRRQLPPRSISWYSQAVLINSGFNVQFGWIFFGFGMIFVWIFGFIALTPLLSSYTEGEVIKVNEQLIRYEGDSTVYQKYKHEIVFTVDREQYSIIHTTQNYSYEKGQKISLKYSGDPSQATIGERSSSDIPWFVPLICGLFPLVGLGFIFFGIKTNLKSLRLLQYGHFTMGKLVSKTDTGGSITVNGDTSRIYDYEFEYELLEQKYLAKCRTHLSHLVEDEKEEVILYDSGNLEYSVVYDAIPNAPKFDEYGRMKSMSFSKIGVLILPILTLLIHGAILMLFVL